MITAPCDNCGTSYDWCEPDETLPKWCHNCEFWDFDDDDTASSWYRIGDIVEFLGNQYADLEYGQRGTIRAFDESSNPARPILVEFDGIDRRIAVRPRIINVIQRQPKATVLA